MAAPYRRAAVAVRRSIRGRLTRVASRSDRCRRLRHFALAIAAAINVARLASSMGYLACGGVNADGPYPLEAD
jgi:hypothetical protein